MSSIDAPAVVIPVYGQYDYARRCLRSLLTNTPDALAIVVEDGHDSWDDVVARKLTAGLDRRRIVVKAHKTNLGVTRAWNTGITEASRRGYRYIASGNSDLLFSSGWWQAAKPALDQVSFVGPVSNAPGDAPEQDVKKWLDAAETTDQQDDIDNIAARLRDKYGDRLEKPTRGWYLNGFFSVGCRDAWEDIKFAPGHYYSNAEELRMVGSENNLFKRASREGMPAKIALSCFIFHYRSITRGKEFLKGMSHYRPEAS